MDFTELSSQIGSFIFSDLAFLSRVSKKGGIDFMFVADGHGFQADATVKTKLSCLSPTGMFNFCLLVYMIRNNVFIIFMFLITNLIFI